MREYETWANDVLVKVRSKMEWVSEKIKIKYPIQQMRTAIMTTAQTCHGTGARTTV